MTATDLIEQHRLCDGKGRARRIDARVGPGSCPGRSSQRNRAGLRQFELGVLVRGHRRRCKGHRAFGADRATINPTSPRRRAPGA